MLHHAQVVADQQQANALLLQALQQVENLGLHRYIQRADRLVGHDELRLADQGASNGDALALTARKFMGIQIQVARPQAHGL